MSANKARNRLIIGFVCALLFALFVLFVHLYLEAWRAETNELWDRISLGDTEAEVGQLLGRPIFEYDKLNAPADYYVSGYGCKTRPITNKVLIYMAKDMIFYIWLDETGKVEDMFRGGS